MKKVNKILLSLVGVASLLGGLSSCNSNNTSSSSSKPITSSSSSNSSKNDSTNNPKGTIELSFWHTFGKSIQEELSKQIDSFTKLVKENEGVDVNITASYQGSYDDLESKITKALATADAPNITVAYPDHVANYLESGDADHQFVVNLDDYITNDTYGLGKDLYLGDDLGADDFVPAFLDEGRHYSQEGTYSFPFMKSTEVMFYNKRYMQQIFNFYEQGIEHMTFFQVAPDPTLACAKLGASQMADFKPDAIIAIGGGSPMDAAKIMWVLYEHPEIDFRDMALDFMDIRKRVYKFPHMGSKAMLVAIPTTAGTGSEVTPFAIITDQDDGTKYPVTDYELLPDMAIIDSDLMLNIPRGLTKASGIDALVHSIEAIASIMSSPYTDAMANEAIKLIFKYLPRAYKNGASDPEAREGMANAATIAGISFANAFLGICHSMGHKLGSYHHIPHGIAVSLVLENVMKFNACEAPTKMGTFPQYDHPVSLHRYAEAARGIGITGKNDEEIFNKFLEAIHQLKVECDIPLTIQEFGVPEDQFLQSLDQMSEDAFNDQCTAANPRYPLISEIKELYLKSYYGK